MRILAVDDDIIARMIVAEALRLAGYSDVEIVESGQRALALIARAVTPFDCFILDIKMPGINGVELCSRIRAMPEYSHVPILMVTALHEREYVEAAILAGATDYLAKPVIFGELSARIRIADRLARQSHEFTRILRDLRTLSDSVENGGLRDLGIKYGLDAPAFVSYRAFEANLNTLNEKLLLHCSIEIFKIVGFASVYMALSEQEVVAVLNETAGVISKRLDRGGTSFTYSGHGVFVSMTKDFDQDDQSLAGDLSQGNLTIRQDPRLSLIASGDIELQLVSSFRFDVVTARHPCETIEAETARERRAGPLSGEMFVPQTMRYVSESDGQKQIDLRLSQLEREFVAQMIDDLGKLEGLAANLEVDANLDLVTTEIQKVIEHMLSVAPVFNESIVIQMANELGAHIEFCQDRWDDTRSFELKSLLGDLLDSLEDRIVERFERETHGDQPSGLS